MDLWSLLYKPSRVTCCWLSIVLISVLIASGSLNFHFLRSHRYFDVGTLTVFTSALANSSTRWMLNSSCSAEIDSPYFRICDPPPCSVRPQPNAPLTFPRQNKTDFNVKSALSGILRNSWRDFPSSVDLYLRTGCNGLVELRSLIESIEAFWPPHVGKIIIVFDPSDFLVSKSVIPTVTEHQYETVFEHIPCLPARIFNQLSYLHLDLYSKSEFVVTIDSDCLFVVPVIPEMLFRNGSVILPHSHQFQQGVWGYSAEYFVGTGTFKFHTMVAQPVSFRTDTFSKYRAFLDQERDCLKNLVHKYIAQKHGIAPFCWMCQLGSFIDTHLHGSGYYLHNCDDPRVPPVMKVAAHTNYVIHTDAFKLPFLLVCELFGEFFHDCSMPTRPLIKEFFTYYDWEFSASSEQEKLHFWKDMKLKLLGFSHASSGASE